jgi:hypothetical protein
MDESLWYNIFMLSVRIKDIDGGLIWLAVIAISSYLLIMWRSQMSEGRELVHLSVLAEENDIRYYIVTVILCYLKSALEFYKQGHMLNRYFSGVSYKSQLHGHYWYPSLAAL